MNLEEMYTVLLGASGQKGAKFDVVHRWFVECKIVDGFLLTDLIFEESFVRLAPNKEELTLTQFIQFMDFGMEDTFDKLKQQGKTDVESLINWMKDAKVIEDAKNAEDKVRHMLKDSADKSSVEFSKFKEALGKVAEEQKKNVEDLSKLLAEQGPKLLEALTAGAAAAAAAGVSAFKDAMTKK